VYASFGSQISHQPALFERIARATAALSWQLVCSAGALAGTDWARALPGAPIVVPYAPQRALLERAQVMITHGGANSVMEALVAGVPLLVSPVCNDQLAQAWFVERAGVGEALDLHEATFEQLAAALVRLGGDGPARLHAARVSASYRAADGARALAERLTSE
jgi:UDP:flavonoid glycosyltransferase YjiC (YdhE family)